MTALSGKRERCTMEGIKQVLEKYELLAGVHLT